MEPLSTIISIISVIEKVYAGGKWVNQQVSEWKPSRSVGSLDEKTKIEGAEYFRLSKDAGIWRTFNLGKEEFREEKRLTHDRMKLVDMYPGLAGHLLVDNRVGQMPYQALDYETSRISVTLRESCFKIPASLRGIYDATSTGLQEHYRRVGIQYEPLRLARVCDVDSEQVENMTIEKASYTDVASTNLIVDLDIRSALGKALLLENGSGTASTLREYELSLSEVRGSCPSFRKSSLANPIGVAGIAITADNKMVLAHRSRSVSTYAGKLAPSSSGYVSWRDVQSAKNGSLDSILRFALEREISEELHLDTTCDISGIYPLGMYRELYRAGMPQAFYGFKINLTSEELIERINDSKSFPEFMGVFFIPVNRQFLIKVITTLARTTKIKSWPIGLEIQGLLAALARNGEKFFFPEG